MIELEALKQQLALLGHTLPDDQIKAILQEMSIEVSEAAGKNRLNGIYLETLSVDLDAHGHPRVRLSLS